MGRKLLSHENKPNEEEQDRYSPNDNIDYLKINSIGIQKILNDNSNRRQSAGNQIKRNEECSVSKSQHERTKNN